MDVTPPAPPSGVLIVDKPDGITSHDVVARVRRLYGTKRVGHTGTLDPLATGVLAVCLGQATRIVEYLTAEHKEYEAGVVFGITTDTEDITGHTVCQTDASHITEQAVRQALKQFTGEISQIPPMVSAVHHNGQRLYELARKGIEVERQPRLVTIHELELTQYTPGLTPTASLRIVCSTGTYIRTLAADIGESLGVGGMMCSLRRTRVGAFSLDQAYTMQELTLRQERGELASCLRSIADSLAHWPTHSLTEEEQDRVLHGLGFARPAGEWDCQRLVLLVDQDREPVAIARHEADTLKPFKVLRGAL